MRVDGLHNPQMGAQGDDRLNTATQQQGAWRGETVAVEKSAASLLADAAEEMTFAQAEREEEKDVSERRVRGAGLMNIPQIQEIMDYLALLGDQSDQAKLEELTSKLASSGGMGAGQAVKDAFDDVSKQFLALGYALHQFEQNGDTDAAALVRDAMEDLHEDHGPQIRAGLNSAGAAHEFAGGNAGQAESFRESYRETVLGREALGETFTSLLQRFGVDDVGRSIHFLVRAAGDDLSARGPSTSPVELQSIMDDLYQLEVLATVLDNCHDLKQAMERDFDIHSVKVDVLMNKLVGLTGERWVTSDKITGLTRDMGVTDVEANISFLTRIKGLMREVPVKTFADPESRDKVLGAVQEALDMAIEDEYE